MQVGHITSRQTHFNFMLGKDGCKLHNLPLFQVFPNGFQFQLTDKSKVSFAHAFKDPTFKLV